ncbi:MAG: hypothetical protein QOI19_1057 [Thermoleophilaceae bacterium]|jgi:hypothetical protein|nr:hypothetical protein [Thermoleophilaceae bacterium]
MSSKLKPILLIGVAGGVVAALRKRSGQASELASRAADAAPEPVKQAVETAVAKVSEAVGDATDGGQDRDATRRYAAPAEAGAQPPAGPGGAPDDEPPAPVSTRGPAEDLQTKAHDLPADTVMPDISDEDPSVREAEDAAAADAAAIGETGDETRP